MSADNLAKGERLHQEALTGHQAATDKVQTISTRLSDTRARMESISQSRLTGSASAQDAAEYAALAGDAALLEKMLSEAQAAAKLANDRVHGAYVWYSDAQRAHAKEQATAEYEALRAKTAEIEAIYVRAIGMTAKLGKAIGHHTLSQSWKPGDTLHRALNLGVPPPMEGEHAS